MIKKKYDFKGREFNRKANLARESPIDKESRTISFILVSKKNAGVRENFWSGERYEEFLDVNGANFERLKTLFKDHNRSVDSAIAKFENIRVEDEQLKADAIFGTDEDSERVFRKYVDGVLDSVSIGYRVLERKVTKREKQLDLVTISRFEIVECSAVGIPFDKGATVGRYLQEDKDLTKEQLEMLQKLQQLENRSAEQEVTLQALLALQQRESETQERSDDKEWKERVKKLEIEKRELERKSDIKDLAEIHRDLLGDKYNEEVNRFLDDKSKTSDDLARHLLTFKRESSSTASFIATGGQVPNSGELARAIEDSISLRAGLNIENTHQDVNIFRGASIVDMGRTLLGIQSYDKHQIAERMMVSAQFANIMANVANKEVAKGYEEVKMAYEQLSSVKKVRDYKETNIVSLSQFAGSKLQRLSEGGDLKEIAIQDGGTSYRVFRWGDKWAITYESIVNDDLGLLNNIGEWAKKIRRFENLMFWDLLQSRAEFANFKMSDGKSLFHTDHKNLDDGSLDKKDIWYLAGADTGIARIYLDGYEKPRINKRIDDTDNLIFTGTHNYNVTALNHRFLYKNSSAELSLDTLEAGELKFTEQTDEVGNRINNNPKFLIVSRKNYRKARKLIESDTDNTQANPDVINPFKNEFQIVTDSEVGVE